MALVRVRMPNGFETNLGAVWAESEGLTVLEEPTTNRDGTPRPQTRAKGRKRKPKTSVSREAAKKKTKTGGEPASPAEEATQ